MTQTNIQTQAPAVTAQLVPTTLAEAGATAAAMLPDVDMERIYRRHGRTRTDDFWSGFRAYRMRHNETAGR